MTNDAPTAIASDRSAPAPRRQPLWPRIRRALFWTHLAAGCIAGLVILLLGVTGALLTYERQIMHAAEASAWAELTADGGERMTVDGLIDAVRSDDFRPSTVTIRPAPDAPVQIAAGRRNRLEVNPFTGEVLPDAAPALDGFFSTIVRLHRWFAFEGEARRTAKNVVGAANIVFLGLLATGLVLWLPPLWRRAFVVQRLRFARRYPTARARDWSWHHVIGFWCLLPLLVISATGTVFNYDWARDSLRWIAGAPAPAEDARGGGQRGGQGGGGHSHGGGGSGHSHGGGERAGAEGGTRGAGGGRPRATALPDALSLQALLDAAATEAEDWNELSLALPRGRAPTVEVTVDRGNGAQIQRQEVMTLDRRTGEVRSVVQRNGDDAFAYSRSVNRFLHTGELFGVPGQTVAGLASIGCALLAWTGLALAWRRLVSAPLRRRRAGQARTAPLAEARG